MSADLLSSDPNLDNMPSEMWLQALKSIARGRADNGKPLSSEIARDAARKCLVRSGVVEWLKRDGEES